ncbi:heparinase II/III domain-containing protein [Pseudoalteromonas spongiae]|uniref:heparinase II/III domain-containing protein n=1 Tax=Pseudoalteromonas spongiae TaxID=298657 RepID=UPI000C2D04D1|nr:heparinase II/III family protein [Pseudoalteromonas spongiae]
MQRFKILILFLFLFLCGCGDKSFNDKTVINDDLFNVVSTNAKVLLDVLENDVLEVSEFQLCLPENSTLNGLDLTIENNQIAVSLNEDFSGYDEFDYCVLYADKKQVASVKLEIESLAIQEILNPPSIIIAGESVEVGVGFNAIVDKSELIESLKAELALSDVEQSVELNLLGVEYFSGVYKITFNVAENTSFYRNEKAIVKVKLLGSEKPLQFETRFYSKPKMAQLNWPQRSIFTRQEYLDNAQQGIIDFHWLNLGKWKLPETHTWEEDPYHNVSWKLFYHSLGWLTPIAQLYKETGDTGLLDKLNEVIISYDQKFALGALDLKTAYREDAVALRVNHLLYLFLEMREYLSVDANNALNSLFEKDAVMLQQYLDDPTYDDDNHGLIQAKSGLNLYSVFSYKDKFKKIGESSLSRVNKASVLMFDARSGQNVEQASEYHFIGISMLLEAKLQLNNLKIEPSQTLIETLDKAILFSAYLLNDEGYTPAIGDSYSNKYWRGYVNRYYELFNELNETFEQFKEYGQDALDNLFVSDNEGLVIAKSRNNSGELNKVFFDAGPKRIVHGHFDNLNLLVQLAGTQLLVDSGGPFNYGNSGRRNFWSISAHNSLVINRLESNEFDAILTQVEKMDGYYYFSGVQPNPDEVNHKRTVIFSTYPEEWVLVLDWVESQDASFRVEEYWHYNKHAEISSANGSLIKVGAKEFTHLTLPNTKTCKLVKGSFDENNIPKLGWVSESYNTAEPAYVKRCESLGTYYQKANLFSQKGKIEHFSVVENESEYVNMRVNNTIYQVDKINQKVSVFE